MKTFPILITQLQTVLIAIAISLLIVSIVMMFVDGVAILIAYISLPFALLALNKKNTKPLACYAALFFIPHALWAWMFFSHGKGKQNNSNEAWPDFSLFESCSHDMFQNKADLEQSLTPSDLKRFEECLANKPE